MARIQYEVHADPEAGKARLTVRNISGGPVELNYRDGQAFDATVTRQGKTVWRWSDGQMFTMALWSRTLGAGEAVTHDFKLPDLPPGTYVLQAAATAMGAAAPPASVEFNISESGPA